MKLNSAILSRPSLYFSISMRKLGNLICSVLISLETFKNNFILLPIFDKSRKILHMDFSRVQKHEVQLLSIFQDFDCSSQINLVFVHASWQRGISHTSLHSYTFFPSKILETEISSIYRLIGSLIYFSRS